MADPKRAAESGILSQKEVKNTSGLDERFLQYLARFNTTSRIVKRVKVHFYTKNAAKVIKDNY